MIQYYCLTLLLLQSLAKPLHSDCKGFKACPVVFPDKLNVHLVPHSHDDVGWVYTIDQYYYNKVQTILGSVVASLMQDPSRRFIQVETAFFKKWWNDQTPKVKEDVLFLIQEGRLEIVNGAWTMNDEGATYYQSIIDQFTYGLRYLEDTLGKCSRPRIGWQIDSFGHSREQASIFSQLGFDAFFFSRLDHRDKSRRIKDKAMDLFWNASENLGSLATIFTTVLYNGYYDPPNLCFDIRCNHPVVIDDEESPYYNLKSRIEDFTNFIEEQAKAYPTNNIIITLGNDFAWEASTKNFVNLEKIIKGFKKFNPKVGNKEVNIFFSTPSCYVKAVRDHVEKFNISLEIKIDDFMPYVEKSGHVWSGYFTSRPNSKRFERSSNNFLQIAKQLTAFAGFPRSSTSKLQEALGVMQHHDAITGTEKEAVKNDYHRLVHAGIQQAMKSATEAIKQLLNQDDLKLKHCPLANISVCPETEKEVFSILIYNPLPRTISRYVQLPVTGRNWTILDPNDQEIEYIVSEPCNKPYNLTSTVHDHVLFFQAENLPGLGYKVYKIKKGTTFQNKDKREYPLTNRFGFEDNYIELDLETGLLQSITLNNITLKVKQEIMYYEAEFKSGAYLFNPRKEALSFGKVKNEILINSSNVIRELKQSWGESASQIIRLFKNEDLIEFNWSVGPIDLSHYVGKEIIMRWSTDISSNGVFYTDSNGREMIRREKNFRPTFNYSKEDPISGNYYPVNSRIAITNEMYRYDGPEMHIITDRSQGGSSLNDGEIELMVHRALVYDDYKGVDENLNEREYGQNIVAKGSHYLIFGSPDEITDYSRKLALKTNHQPFIFYLSKDIVYKSKSFLQKDLPENIHLLTLETWNPNEVLIRLEYILEKNGNEESVSIDLKNLFTTFEITSMKETLLDGNIGLEDEERLKWSQFNQDEGNILLSKVKRLQRSDDDLQINIAPMQIRTFIAAIRYMNNTFVN